MSQDLGSRYGLYTKIIPEASYPVLYREKDASAIFDLIKKQESVCLIGMKRVGISNFLRFLAFNPLVKERYFGPDQKKFLLVVTDANDLVEISPRAFWLMLLLRLTETLQSQTTEDSLGEALNTLLEKNENRRDPFLVLESLKQAVGLSTSSFNFNLVFFLIRFDRLQPLMNLQFFANLQALRDVAKHKVSYLLTARRRLPELCPDCFIGASLNLFARSFFLRPASRSDMESISSYFERKIAQDIQPLVKEKIFELCAGHVQFTQLALIAWSEWNKKDQLDIQNLLKHLLQDERILLQCEEIWENLLPVEREFLKKVTMGKRARSYEEKGVAFVFESGLILKHEGQLKIFSPLLTGFVQKRLTQEPNGAAQEYSSKEYQLFRFLQGKSGQLCSREEIIEAVWPDYAETGISDWTIDRLVFRLRKKMFAKEEPYRIRTIRGRGFILAEN